MITKKQEQNPRKKINRAMGKPHFTNKFCWKTPKNDNATCKLILNSFTVHTTTQQPYAVTTKYYSTTCGFCRGFPGDRSDRQNDPKTGEKFLRKHWQSTEKEERKGTVTTFSEQWKQPQCLLYFGCLTSSKIQTLVLYFQTFSVFFFFLRMNWQSECIPSTPHPLRLLRRPLPIEFCLH